MAQILIVDDEPSICEILGFNLEAEGYECLIAHSAEAAEELLTPSCSLVLLDVMMGGMSGYKYAELLRKRGDVRPIIFLTARDTENDLLTGFAVGADDYISKPFSLQEVKARVKAVLKRSEAQKADAGTDAPAGTSPIVIDTHRKEVSVDGTPVVLTKKEFEILLYLYRAEGRLVSRDELIRSIWSETPYVTERTVDVHIARLRKKLGDYSSALTNRSGYGYCLKIPTSQP